MVQYCIIHGFGLLSALLFLEYYVFRLGKLILVSYEYSLFSSNMIQHAALHQAAGQAAFSCRVHRSHLGTSPLFHPGYHLLMTSQTKWDALHHPDIETVFLGQFSGSNESSSVCTMCEALFWYSLCVIWSRAHLCVLSPSILYAVTYYHCYRIFVSIFLILKLIDLQGISLD